MASDQEAKEQERRKLPLEQQLLLDDEQQKAYDELKRTYKEKVHDVDFTDADLLKFLRARKFNVHKTITVLKNYVQWYEHITNDGNKFKGPFKPLTIERVRFVLEKKIIMLTNTRDRDGHAILYMRPAQFFPSKLPTPELMRAVVYCLERISDDPMSQMYGFTFIADMKGWGWSNFETSYAQTFMGTVESRVSIRLRKFIVVDTPSWFGMVWAIIRNFFSAKFASKWHFVSRASPQLDALIAPDQLPNDFTDGQAVVDMDAFIRERYKIEGIPWTETATEYNDSSDKIFHKKVEH